MNTAIANQVPWVAFVFVVQLGRGGLGLGHLSCLLRALGGSVVGVVWKPERPLQIPEPV